MMLLIVFYAAVLFITAWTLIAVFSASPLPAPGIRQESPSPRSPVAARR